MSITHYSRSELVKVTSSAFTKSFDMLMEFETEGNVSNDNIFVYSPSTAFTVTTDWQKSGSYINPKITISGTIPSIYKGYYLSVVFYTTDNSGNIVQEITISAFIYTDDLPTAYTELISNKKVPNIDDIDNGVLALQYILSEVNPTSYGKIRLITNPNTINNGFKLNGVLDTSTAGNSVYGISTYQMDSGITFSADVKNSYKITGSYDSGCSISNVPVTVAEGESVYIDVTKKQGYKITSVLVDGVSQSLPSQTAGSGTVLTIPFTNVTSNHTITAVSTLYTYTISTSAGSGGSISSSITAQYGKNYTVNITPNTGYEISDVTVDGTSVGKQSSYTFNNVIANHTVYATFSKIPETKYNVYVTTVDNGNIVVSPSVATAGTKISISVNPSTGYQLKQITSEPSVVISNNSFTMPENNITLTAEFESVVIPNYTITIGTSLYGSAVANYDIASAGTVVTLSATPSTGYYLKGYNSQPFVSILNGQFIMPSNDVTVTPVFDKEDIEKTSYDIYIKSESSTMGDVSVTGIDESKGLITLKAEPEIGYSFSEWEISDGVCYLSSPFTAETIMIIQDSDVSVIAHFVKDELPSRVNQVHLTITK